MSPPTPEDHNVLYDAALDSAKRQARDWIVERFPWMTEDNVSHGISQGVYFAWHG